MAGATHLPTHQSALRSSFPGVDILHATIFLGSSSVEGSTVALWTRSAVRIALWWT